MKSLLHALNDGRLIELPDNDKTMALEYLAALIEAIPDIHFREEGIAEKVLERETAYNTGIGKGWACPHGRFAGDGDLVCAVGMALESTAPDARARMIRLEARHAQVESAAALFLSMDSPVMFSL